MFKIIILFIFSFPTFALVIGPIKGEYKYHEAHEFQAIMSYLRTFEESSPKKEAVVSTRIVEKKLSRGQQIIEEIKAKNRAILAEKNQQEKAEHEKNSTLTQIEKWKVEEKKTLNDWKKNTYDQLNQWKREQEIFLGRIKIYKENTFKIPIKEEKIIETDIPIQELPESHIVNATFKVPIRDQLARPTCVAFAGIRAIETLLAQNNFEHDLSEQYLYWAGKPSCQKVPCSEKGSWVTKSYKHSQTAPQIDIPLESKCSYKGESVLSNETQIPLPPTCSDGMIKVHNYEEVRTIADVVDYLKRDVPVVIAAKLSENFYKNKGLISLSESHSSGAKLDAHAMGHAFLAVGIIELPEKLKLSEGHFCFVVANSWGIGWGVGGYSCITQKWLEKYRQPSPFIAVTKLGSKSLSHSGP
jgi:C1A family cysteine protease